MEELEAKLRLAALRNRENLDFAIKLFEDMALDISDTLGPATRQFADGMGTYELGDKAEMHDAAHVLIGQTRAFSKKAEAHVGVAEIVLLRGPYDCTGFRGLPLDARNMHQADIIEKPARVPELDIAIDLGRQRLDMLNKRPGSTSKVAIAFADLKGTYDLCCKIDEFFMAVTNGRNMDHFSTLPDDLCASRWDIYIPLRDLPIAFFGLRKKEDGEGYELMPEEQRDVIIKMLEENRPHPTPVWDVESDPRLGISLDDPILQF